MKPRVLLVLAPPMATFYTIGVMANFLPLYARSLGAGFTLVGALSTAFFASSTPSSVILGRIADKLGGVKLILSLSMALNTLALISMMLIRDPALLILPRLLQGVALSATTPLSMVAAAGSLGVSGSVGLTGSLNGVGFTLGGVVGGILSGRYGYASSFLSAAIVSAASAMLVWGYPIKEAKPPASKGWLSDLGRIPAILWLIYAALFVRQLGASGAFAVLPIYMEEHLGAPDEAVGAILSLNPLSQTVFFHLLSRLEAAASTLFYSAGLYLSGLVFAGYILAPSYLWVAPVQIILGLAWSLINVAGYILAMRLAPGEARYTATSLFNTTFNAAWIVGALLGGRYMDSHGVEAWMIIAVLMAAAAGTLVLATSPRLRAGAGLENPFNRRHEDRGGAQP